MTRQDPMTLEQFEPRTQEQMFINKGSFLTFIESLDPLDSFEVVKRKIGWDPIERNCRECGEKFVADHPAIHYCENHRHHQENQENQENRKEEGDKKKVAPRDYYKPREKECMKCQNLFVSTTPAMRYCENCSDKGGKLVNQSGLIVK